MMPIISLRNGNEWALAELCGPVCVTSCQGQTSGFGDLHGSSWPLIIPEDRGLMTKNPSCIVNKISDLEETTSQFHSTVPLSAR